MEEIKGLGFGEGFGGIGIWEYSMWGEVMEGGERARRWVRLRDGGMGRWVGVWVSLDHEFMKWRAERPSATVWWTAAPRHTPPQRKKVSCKF